MAEIPGQADLAGVVLAGGRGGRLGGVRKADLRIGGVRLLDRALDCLTPEVGCMLISSGAFGPIELSHSAVGELVPDGEFEGVGPAAGLFASARRLKDIAGGVRFMVSLAVDTPYAPKDLVPRLVEALTPDVDAAIAAFDGQAYPTNALWRIDPLIALSREARGETRFALRTLFPADRMRRVNFPAGPAGNPFRNVNEPRDLIAFARMARSGSPDEAIGVLAKPDKPAKRSRA